MDSIVTVLVEVSGEKSTRERNKMCCQSFGIAKNTHVVLLSFVSSIIMFSIIYMSSPGAAVGVSLHECVVTSGSPLVPLRKDTVASVVDAHSVHLRFLNVFHLRKSILI